MQSEERLIGNRYFEKGAGMRKRIINAAVVLILLVMCMKTENVNATESFEQPQIIRCTCYCDQGYTKSGQWVREGIIAGKEEWMGKAAYLYEVKEDGSIGDFIGIYEFLDTGYGINGSLIEGTSVDVYQPTLERCYEWIGEYGDYVYMQIIDGKG